MSKENGGIPWPIWAAVTILVALIGAYATMNRTPSNDNQNPPPQVTPSNDNQNPPLNSGQGGLSSDEISGKYLMDQLSHRIIVISHIENNKYRIEEPSGSWPWTGTATLDGGHIIGEAKFINSLATMRVEGVRLGNRSIRIQYRFITDGDGKPNNKRIDYHTWYPTN